MGHYRIIRRLAVGGMAEVYLGKRIGAGGFEKPVAIKRMLPTLAAQQENARAFLAEARLCVHLVHPNIVQVLDLGTSNGTPYLVMELVDGEDLRRVLNRSVQAGRPFEAAEAIHITACVAQALAHADETPGPGGEPLKVVHRDVNPSNVLISMAGEVKLADFGVAKAADGRVATEGNLLKGKLGYLAPELIGGAPASHSSDVFLAGVLLYELLAGRPLFATDASPGRTLAQIAGHDEHSLPLPERAPPELEAVLRKALAKDPANRYAHARELANDLLDVLEEKRWRVGSYELAARMAALFPNRTRLDKDLTGGVPLVDDRDAPRTPPPPPKAAPAERKRLGEMLVEAGLLTDSQLQTLLARQRLEGGRLGEWVVNLDFAPARSVLRTLSRQLGVPFISDEKLLETEPPQEILSRFSRETALRMMALPLAVKDGVIFCAMCEPGHLENLDLLRFQIGARMQPVLCTEFGLRRAISRVFGGRQDELKWRQIDGSDPMAMLTTSTRLIDFGVGPGGDAAQGWKTPTPTPWNPPVVQPPGSQRERRALPSGPTPAPAHGGIYPMSGGPNSYPPGGGPTQGMVPFQPVGSQVQGGWLPGWTQQQPVAGPVGPQVASVPPPPGYILAYVPTGIGPDGQPTYVTVPVPSAHLTPPPPPRTPSGEEPEGS